MFCYETIELILFHQFPNVLDFSIFFRVFNNSSNFKLPHSSSENSLIFNLQGKKSTHLLGGGMEMGESNQGGC